MAKLPDRLIRGIKTKLEKGCLLPFAVLYYVWFHIETTLERICPHYYPFSEYLARVLGHKQISLMKEMIWRTNHRVQISCSREPIGGWVICPAHLSKGDTVYSLGVGDDIAFDLALIQKFGADVFAFDPTPGAISWVANQRIPRQFHFLSYGVADFDGTACFQHYDGVNYGIQGHPSVHGPIVQLEVHRLSTIMKRLGHSKIDLLKINIEGSEYVVIKDLLLSDLPVRQMVVEFHHRYPGYALSQTEHAVRALNEHGYKIFHISENRKEYSFLRGPQYL